jgi:hypothetical protein
MVTAGTESARLSSSAAQTGPELTTRATKQAPSSPNPRSARVVNVRNRLVDRRPCTPFTSSFLATSDHGGARRDLCDRWAAVGG